MLNVDETGSVNQRTVSAVTPELFSFRVSQQPDSVLGRTHRS